MQNQIDERPASHRRTTPSALSRCLMEGDGAATVKDRRQRQKALGVSFVIETVVLALLIAAPLLTSIAQPQLSRLEPPLPIVMVSWNTHSRPHAPLPRPTRQGWNFRGTALRPLAPKPVADLRQTAEPGNEASLPILGGYIPGAIQVSELRTPDPPLEPPLDPHRIHENRIVKVSEGVLEAQLVARIEPRYPALARQARMQGTVLLHAFISVDGSITGLEVVSGPPLLVQAAVDAVRQWRYRPTYLNGEAVAVETSITVIFRLDK